MFNSRLMLVVSAALVGLLVPATALALKLRAAGRTGPAKPAARAPAGAAALAPAKARTTPTSASSKGVSEVGPLYASSTATRHQCTAGVVDSPRHDTVITAAHCVGGTGVGMVFAPGAYGSQTPYGRWTVTAVHIAPEWAERQDPHEDVAFLTVAPRRINGAVKELEDVTGAYRLGTTAGAGARVTVTGYPGGSANSPITCATTTYLIGAFPAFDCRGYVGGTSGSPWVRATAHGPEVVGVIGGLHQGGCVDSTSYSPPLAAAARLAFQRASAHVAADTAPAADPDGC